MTDLIKLEIRCGEIRQRLSAIGGMDELTDETRAELDALKREYSDTEGRVAALKIAGEAPTATIETRSSEGREYRRLTERANVGQIFDSILNHRTIDGATAELQTHHNLDTNQVPLALMIRNWPGEGELETRAVSPAPANVGQNQQSIIPYVFPMSAASYLMVDMPTVPVGESVWPVLTSELDVNTPAENSDSDETTASFSADILTPARIQAAFFYSREDKARFAGMDAALRENLSMGLADGLDKAILSSTTGLFTGTHLASNNVTAVTDYDGYLTDFAYGRVDGRYASTVADIRMVVGAGTYAHMGSVYRNTSVDRTILDRLMDVTGGVRVSAHVPAVSAANKQNAVIKLGSSVGAVAPIWEGVTLIPDEITLAKKGQIQITGVMLYAMKVVREDAYHKQQSQHA